MRNPNLLLAILFISLVLLSFTKKKPPVKLPKAITEKYAYIPAGTTYIEKDSIIAGDFYISRFEVSNMDYNTFLMDIKVNKPQDVSIASIDTINWQIAFASPDYPRPFVTYYHSHPEFMNYPVVNISYEAAQLYCSWLTEKTNNEVKFENDLKAEFRLPTRKEWLRAAAGTLDHSSYAWGGPFIRNSRGELLCNFKSIGYENIHFDEETKTYKIVNENESYMGVAGILNDNAEITAPVRSYVPNDYGLYNMNGNAAEMVSEKGIAVGGSWNSPGYDVRNESVMKHEGSSLFVGFRPIFTLVKKDA